MARPRPCIIVLKLGTSSIVHEKTHQPLLSTLSALVETVVHLRSQGHKVVLVSSGAIGVGLKRMEMPTRPKGLAGKQVSLHQFRLILVLTEQEVHRHWQPLVKADSLHYGTTCSVNWDSLSHRYC
jgi:glutamate 5-kinase